MSFKIGCLLPRSTEYPAMAFDLLDGLKLSLRRQVAETTLLTENTGFGETLSVVYGLAEKMVMQDEVQLLVVYATSLNAEDLYRLAKSSSCPIIFLDAGMEVFEAKPQPLCYHITLQGMTACRLLAAEAARKHSRLFLASSFLDAGYRSGWVFQTAVESAGSAVSGHFVSKYMPADFTLAPLEQQLAERGADAVLADFTSYLDALFMNGVRAAGPALKNLPIYCSPFMADEQQLQDIEFPQAELRTVAPWSRALQDGENTEFMDTIRREKGKEATIFHLLGWEAGQAAAMVQTQGAAALSGNGFRSPRGEVRFHPDTHSAYAPLYAGTIDAAPDGRCRLAVDETLAVSPELHAQVHFSKPDSQYSRWRNNYFCI